MLTAFAPLSYGALTLLALLTACPANMPKAAVGAKKVKVTVVVILASEMGNQIDPLLKDIGAEIQKKDERLRSFKLVSMSNESLAVNQKSSFKLVEDQVITIAVHHGADTEDKVKLAVTAPMQKEFVYRTVCGKFLPIVTRYLTRNAERLIIAIRVQPCKGEQ